MKKVANKLDNLSEKLHEQFASLPEIREDIRLPDAIVNEIKRELVKGYERDLSGESYRFREDVKEKRGGKLKIVYKKERGL